MVEYNVENARKSTEKVQINVEKVEKETKESRKARLMAYLDTQNKNGKE